MGWCSAATSAGGPSAGAPRDAGPTALETLLARDPLAVPGVLTGAIAAASAWLLAGAGIEMRAATPPAATQDRRGAGRMRHRRAGCGSRLKSPSADMTRIGQTGSARSGPGSPLSLQ
jgi:hypothetical protein